VLRRHAKAARRGQFVLPEQDRLFNPSRETVRLIGKVAKLGPQSELPRPVWVYKFKLAPGKCVFVNLVTFGNNCLQLRRVRPRTLQSNDAHLRDA
jgi:hypothetical protein